MTTNTWEAFDANEANEERDILAEWQAQNQNTPYRAYTEDGAYIIPNTGGFFITWD